LLDGGDRCHVFGLDAFAHGQVHRAQRPVVSAEIARRRHEVVEPAGHRRRDHVDEVLRAECLPGGVVADRAAGADQARAAVFGIEFLVDSAFLPGELRADHRIGRHADSLAPHGQPVTVLHHVHRQRGHLFAAGDGLGVDESHVAEIEQVLDQQGIARLDRHHLLVIHRPARRAQADAIVIGQERGVCAVRSAGPDPYHATALHHRVAPQAGMAGHARLARHLVAGAIAAEREAVITALHGVTHQAAHFERKRAMRANPR